LVKQSFEKPSILILSFLEASFLAHQVGEADCFPGLLTLEPLHVPKKRKEKKRKKLYATIKNTGETPTIIIILRGSSTDYILNLFFNDYEFE